MNIENELLQYIARENDVEQALLDYLRSRSLTGSEACTLNSETRLMESGLLDSLELMSLVSHVEQRYGFHLRDDEYAPENFETPRSVAAMIRRAIASRK
jgi:acyl carrier protein